MIGGLQSIEFQINLRNASVNTPQVEINSVNNYTKGLDVWNMRN
ncbi:hypothetical protein J2X69_000721 [Algoriphagus sp. 4150]|nr:hypothetical protein [Algoriphagus sp. 4150]